MGQDAQILIVKTNELRREKPHINVGIETIQLPGAAVARRFAREGLTVALARYLTYLTYTGVPRKTFFIILPSLIIFREVLYWEILTQGHRA